ncbi:RNA polymerase factor sigma-54 [Capnocytophaga catalasegens]|uniref:RNA polymerase sigma-54 factor n=1 Tax=Capnocytophaga catalasegens TaxID=1004260 RepID=A0AAV5B037_9FLAO|nr:RNA polymerase factor sigma-54 [Capnocytophaga catalasegens]GIZ16158.1 RNA polymerase sigma-54 factor [Capnocytophaga catalasegens]GJM50898.1 RNA polymerase sigma-54 factor [Capnocytophaga catalasegens]GJM53742.1 RNA polymerase sigma-54 factor [Capnocytophaga catalasegens]
MLKQQLQLKLAQKLSPQQIQLMKLVQLPTLAFEQRVKQELEENPALESGVEESSYEEDVFADEFDNSQEDYEDREIIEASDINVDEYLSDDEIPEYRLHTNNYSDDDADYDIPYKAEVSFHQSLLNQLNTFRLTDLQRDIAEFLVGSINDNGYIRRELTDITDDLAFTQNIYTDVETVEKVLRSVIFQLDPAGVGARNLQECLLIQLERKNHTLSVLTAIDILKNNFDLFSKKHYEKLTQKYSISEENLKKVIAEIERLNPKPGYSEEMRTEQIIPDFTIRENEGELELLLNGRNAPELHVSKDYIDLLETYKDSKNKSGQKEAVLFIKQKLDAARWFIDAVKQRQHTLYITMNAIMIRQKEYFLTGDETKLKPLILKDIAEMVDMDVSTISRVASSKYVNTPYGTKLIKEFFSEGIKNEVGEDISTHEVKDFLQTIIDGEDKKKPYPDDQLTLIMKEKGYPIARRTVAKYREQLGIPVARLRKELD